MSLWAGRMCSEKAHEGNLRNHWWAQCFLTREAPKQFPAKNAARICRHLGPQGPKVSPKVGSASQGAKDGGWSNGKPHGCFGQTSIDWHRLVLVEKKRPLKRETSPNGMSTKSGKQTEWSVLISGGMLHKTHIWCSWSLRTSSVPLFFLSIKKNAAKTWRGCLKRPRVKHVAKKQAKTINHFT